jgi:hypothetical protein
MRSTILVASLHFTLPDTVVRKVLQRAKQRSERIRVSPNGNPLLLHSPGTCTIFQAHTHAAVRQLAEHFEIKEPPGTSINFICYSNDTVQLTCKSANKFVDVDDFVETLTKMVETHHDMWRLEWRLTDGWGYGTDAYYYLHGRML